MAGSNDRNDDDEKATGRFVTSRPLLGGRYRLTESLGEQGAVDVYVAVDRFLEREVLIEVLRADVSASSEGIAAFRRAAVSLAEAESPHLLAVHDVGIDTAGVYLVVQRPSGPTLVDEVAKRGPMAPIRGIRLLQQVLIGLGAVHTAGLVHGEVTPANVVLTSRDRAVLRPPPILAGSDRSGEQVKLSPPGLRADLEQVLATLVFMLSGYDASSAPKRSAWPLGSLPPQLAAIVRDRANPAAATMSSTTRLRDALDHALHALTSP